MSHGQPQDPFARPVVPDEFRDRMNVQPHAQSQYPSQYPAHYQPQQAAPRRQARPSGLTAAGSFWYVLQCVAFGAGYFCKVPAKKAMQDFGMVRMTSAEQFWYVLMCIPFGAGYFAKLPISKALSEMPQSRQGY